MDRERAGEGKRHPSAGGKHRKGTYRKDDGLVDKQQALEEAEEATDLLFEGGSECFVCYLMFSFML
jgi:hypothetical protein